MTSARNHAALRSAQALAGPRQRALAFLFALLAISSLARAEKKSAAKTPEEIEGALEREKAALTQLSARETSLLGRLADLERQVELEGRSFRAAQAKLKFSQTRLSGAEASEETAQAEVDAAMSAIGPRLTARYQLGREGYVRFLLGARSVTDLLRRKRLYSALLQSDLDALSVLRVKAKGATAAKQELQAARDELAQSAAVEQERRSTLEWKASLQKRALTSVQQEKGVHDQAVRELEQAARALADRLRVIEEARRAGKAIPLEQPALLPDAAPGQLNEPPASAASGSAASTANNSAAAASPSATAASKSPGAASSTPAAANGSAAGSTSASANAEPPGKKLAMISPPIRKQRGKLLFPVAVGRVEVRFGRTVDPRFGTITLQRGLDIRAPEGTEVHAIYSGTVVHAGWFSGYGNLVILDHGDGLFSLFAHLATLAHAVGDQVDRGDALGTVGDTGSLKGPYLYFELRDGQKPLDPERWLSRSRKPAPIAPK